MFIKERQRPILKEGQRPYFKGRKIKNYSLINLFKIFVLQVFYKIVTAPLFHKAGRAPIFLISVVRCFGLGVMIWDLSVKILGFRD